MRPTFLAFETAHRALAAQQAQIDVTGNNLANAETPGYTRQRVDLNAISNSGYTTKFASSKFTGGWGVNISSISQIRDPFLDARYRNEAAENGRFNSVVAGLGDLERILDEVDTNGLQNEITSFVKQLQILSQYPTDTDMAMIARTAAQKVTQILNVNSNQINEVREQQIFDLDKIVIDNEFNSVVKNIAALNKQIREENLHGNAPNDLYDQRNILIDDLSQLANIKVTTGAEKVSEGLSIETLSIAIYDENTGRSISLIQNDLYNTLSVVRNPDDSSLLSLEINASFNAPEDYDITKHFSGGSIKGYLDLINGSGSYADSANANHNGFRGTLYYQKTLDTFAANFAHALNGLNTVPPADPADNQLFSSSGGVSITAGNIRISEDWLNDPGHITTSTNAGSSEPDNVLRMIKRLTTDTSKFFTDPSAGTTQVFEGTFTEYLASLTGELSLDIELYTNFQKTSDSVMSQLFSARESVSGVVQDEEGVKLMTYQKSYNAAARYFTVLDEAVDTIINKMGLVGR
ncbi:MAG: flagellar hook-associated protein FlgK [Eubacteriales bacterium]|nr:flagellar hook-associated protein FlgK [Eubacteriales bacterium]